MAKKKKEISKEPHKMITHYELDKWQKEVIALPWKTNICINIGRQSGKSDTIAIKTGETIANNPKLKVLIISITEDQAQRMLQKIMLYLHDNYPQMIGRGKDKPTLHKVVLTNGSEAVTKAVGQYGFGVLGMTVDIIVPDEAAYLPEAIWQSITPMLLTSGGVLWLLSTMNTKEGFFYKAFTDPTMGFKTYYYTSEQVANERPEPQRTIMLQYLEREKARMTKLEYAQQYLSQALEELGQFFPDKLINECQTLQRENYSISTFPPSGEFYLGMDVARMGGDATTFEVFEKIKDTYYQRENIVNTYTLTTETIKKTLELDNKYHFKRIYIDDGGLGVAVFDQLLDNEQTKSRIIPINNATRALDRDENRKKKLLKEDLYLNAKYLMENNKVKLLKDSEIFSSMKSVVIETQPNQEIRIHGRDTHIVEGIIRALWSNRDKHIPLNIYFKSL